jgi:hypothetical protein
MTNAVRLVVALVILALLQFLHLLDDLRIDPTATVVSSLLKPQAVAGIGGALLAAVLVATANPWGRRLALLTASLVALGFLVIHGSPIKTGPFHPYWGAGSADAIQWAGVLLIWTCSAYVILATTDWAPIRRARSASAGTAR